MGKGVETVGTMLLVGGFLWLISANQSDDQPEPQPIIAEAAAQTTPSLCEVRDLTENVVEFVCSGNQSLARTLADYRSRYRSLDVGGMLPVPGRSTEHRAYVVAFNYRE